MTLTDIKKTRETNASNWFWFSGTLTRRVMALSSRLQIFTEPLIRLLEGACISFFDAGCMPDSNRQDAVTILICFEPHAFSGFDKLATGGRCESLSSPNGQSALAAQPCPILRLCST